MNDGERLGIRLRLLIIKGSCAGSSTRRVPEDAQLAVGFFHLSIF